MFQKIWKFSQTYRKPAN